MEESLLLRQIPHSVEAEQSVLGAMLIDARCIPDVIEALQAQFDLTIAKSKIVQEEPIKSFGTYQLKCKLGYEIIGTVNVVVTEET